jgi:hypothetical protein
VSVLLGNGDSTFQTPLSFTAGSNDASMLLNLSDSLAACIPVTTLEVSSLMVTSSGILTPSSTSSTIAFVDVTTSYGLLLGSTDLVMEFDPDVVRPVFASSETLSGFTYSIDLAAGRVNTASAAFPYDPLGGARCCSRWSSQPDREPCRADPHF